MEAHDTTNTNTSADCCAELGLLTERFKRLQADVENARKREERDRAHYLRSIQVDFFKELLPVLDDYDRAYTQYGAAGSTGDVKAVLEGFDLVGKQLRKFLERYGVTPIAQLTIFDPTIHEAIADVLVPDKPDGTIVEVLRPGYLFRDSLLRTAQVVVSRAQ